MLKKIEIIKYAIKKKQANGVLSLLLFLTQKGFGRLYRLFLYPISVFIALLLILLRPVVKVKFIRLFSQRIGHYSANTELIVSAIKKELVYKGNKIFFYTYPGAVCNIQLHKMWKRVIPIIPFPNLLFQIDNLLCLILKKNYHSDDFNFLFESGGFRDNDIYGIWDQFHRPHIFFTPKENEEGIKLMEDLGVPKKALFICLIIRDSKYLSTQYPESDFSYHDYRDADVENYKEAALFLAEKGYYVIRMGKYVNQSFDVNHPRVIDYANHPLRCDLLDVYLSAHCYFFISTGVGLDCIPYIFDRPILWTDVIFPVVSDYNNFWLFIPKRIIQKNTRIEFTFKEMYQMYQKVHPQVHLMMKANNLQVVNNSAEEILKVVKEMEARVTSSWREENEDIIQQQKFWKSFQHIQKDVHGVPISSATRQPMRIGKDFLKQNALLLD